MILLGKADDRQQKKILQYQRAEGIYEDLLKILGYKPLEEQEKLQKGVIMFFSPEGMIVTEPAVMTAQFLGTKGRCLFVSLSGFPVYFDGEFSKDPHWQKETLVSFFCVHRRSCFQHSYHSMFIRLAVRICWLRLPIIRIC